MRPPRLLVQTIAFIVGAVYVLVYLYQGLPTGGLLQPLGAATALASLLFLLFDHLLWRLPGIDRLSKRPDIRGTWKGQLASNWIVPDTGRQVDPDPEVYLVIEQTFWSVSAVLITEESKSCSTMALLEDDGCGQKQLVVMYRNTPRASVRHRSEVHHGSFKLDLSGKPVNRLEGYYWTDRSSMGEFELERYSKQQAGSFTEARNL
jgi:hypothetical protein